MRREQGRDSRDMLADIQFAHAKHPLVEERCDLLVLQMIITVKTFDYFSYGVGKDARFIVIAVSTNRIDLKVGPHGIKESILFRKERLIVHEDNGRLARHFPTSYFYMQPFVLCSMLLPIGKKFLVFFKICRCCCFPDIRSNKNDFVFKNLLQGMRLG